MTRTTFSVSRAAEFFSEKELQMQMGADRDRWLHMLVKELIDNALDACETANITPVIRVEVDENGLTVTDNGPGIPGNTVAGSLDFNTRTSSNNLYISPTRGQLGNALKCLYAAGLVVHDRCAVTITARGNSHAITVGFDAIRGEPVIGHVPTPVAKTTGTVVKVCWPGAASELGAPGLTSPAWLAWRYGLVNPHITIEVAAGEDASITVRPCGVQDQKFEKWTPAGSPPPALWFEPEQFRQLLCAFLASEPQMYAPGSS